MVTGLAAAAPSSARNGLTMKQQPERFVTRNQDTSAESRLPETPPRVILEEKPRTLRNRSALPELCDSDVRRPIAQAIRIAQLRRDSIMASAP